MRISDWSSDVCSSDLALAYLQQRGIDFAALGRIPGSLRWRPDIGHPDHKGQVDNRHAAMIASIHALAGRSEERRVGKEWVSPCRSRWLPYHLNKKKEASGRELRKHVCTTQHTK